MNGTIEMVKSLLSELLIASRQESSVDMAVFPPFPYLAQVQDMLKYSNIAWGAQNLNPASKGAYTGEVSAAMLLNFDCRYVLVGHSERRALFGESDRDVALRFEAAHQAGLEPVLCVGETLAERGKRGDRIRGGAAVGRGFTRQWDRCIQTCRDCLRACLGHWNRQNCDAGSGSGCSCIYT